MNLPSKLQTLVQAYMAEQGLDYYSPKAMWGRCETESYGLSRYLRQRGLSAGPVQIDVPCEDELALGHFVVLVRFVETEQDEDGDEWETARSTWRVDLTAAQFEIYDGPQAVEIT